MKKTKFSILIILLIMAFACRNDKAKELKQINNWTRNDSLSYAEGVILKSEIKANFDSLNMELLWSALSGKDSLLTFEEAERFLFNERKRRIIAMQKAAHEEMEFWKLKPEFKVHTNGMVFKISGKGNGKKAINATNVKTKQVVTLANGVVLEDTKNEAVVLGLENINENDGFRNSVLLLEEGETIECLIPYFLAFGPMGTQDGSVPPYANLQVKIELVEIIN